MSFYTCNRTGSCPGVVNGNPLNGICEKACIQVDKVLDAAMRQIQLTNTQVELTNQSPANPTTPLTFISAAINGQTTINNLTVDRLVEKPNFARVSFSSIIPLLITYTDANGVAGSGTANVTVPVDVVLYVPQPSLIPYQVTAFANAICSGGAFVSGSTFTIDPCITLIIRVVVDAELLIPTYGYCQIPPCQDYTQDVCTGFFDLPLYPAQQAVNNPTQCNL